MNKPTQPMNLILCQDDRDVQLQMGAVVSEIKKLGHDITLQGVGHVDYLIRLLDKQQKEGLPLPTDIIMDVLGNGAPAAKRVIEWFEKNHPEAPLPSFNFLSLNLDMAINAAAQLRIDDGRVLAGAIYQSELTWTTRHLKTGNVPANDVPETLPRMGRTTAPNTIAFRQLMNEKLGMDLPLDQSGDPYTSQKLKQLNGLANDGIVSEWVRGNLSAEEAISRMRGYFTGLSDSLQSTLHSSGAIDPALKADASFYGAAGLPQKGQVVFSVREAYDTAAMGKNPILVMNSYDPDVVPLLASTKLGGLIVVSSFMASHLKLLCETYGVSGLFGVAPKGKKTFAEEFNEEAQPDAPAYFDGSSVTIGGEKISRGQNILINLDGNGMVFNPPASLKTVRPDTKKLGIDDQFKLKTMRRCFDEYFKEKGLPRHGVKANVSSIRYGADDPADGIGLVRTEQMVAKNATMLRYLKDLFKGNANAYQDFARSIQYDYHSVMRKLENGPVKIRLFDFVHSEILNKEEQKEFLEKYSRLDIHGGEALATWPQLYRDQVKAIFGALLEAGVTSKRPLEIMMPAVRTEQDVLTIKKIIEEEAARRNIKPWQYKFGVMAETLDACRNIEKIAPHCDFISFGTNDLTQEQTGIGRGDLKAQTKFAKENGYDPFKVLAPEVLDIVRDVTARGRLANPGLKVDVCGAQAANIDSAVKLFDAGIDNISVAPTPANMYGLPMLLNYRMYDALQKKAPAPKRARKLG